MSDPVTRLNAALEGRYRIERELGEGGMATVYLARDEKHNRNVALKVLKPELAAVVGAERFLAEIETTANLQHPHILPLFDSGEADSFLFYVMPYVEGETLRERIDRDKQLPVDEAVRIASDIAEALDHAHRQGIVHRDIKPANVLLRDGRPLIADFGIALAVGAAGGTRLTETGLSVGTPFYMSPEQATGDQQVGPPGDTYALAAVLYEMLVGEPPYLGNTAQAVLGKIIQGAPVSATSIRRSVPANVDAAIRKALEKLPADRFTGAQSFAKALGDPGFRYGDMAGTSAAAPRRRWQAAALTGVAGLLIGITGMALSSSGNEAPSPGLVMFAFEPPGATLGSTTNNQDVAISPDGRLIAYNGPNPNGGAQISLRAIDQLIGVPLRGAAGIGPFFSPDGEWVGYTDNQVSTSLQKVSTLGGSPVMLATASSSVRGASWGADDQIVFGTFAGGLFRVSGGGGEPESLTALDGQRGETSHRWPSVIDGREAVLFTVLEEGSVASAGELAVLDRDTGEARRLGVAGTSPRYVSTGHVVFAAEDGSVRAVPFDLGSLEVTGSAVPLVEGVNVKGNSGAANFGVSDDGRLVYVGGGATGGTEWQLVWVDPQGREEALPTPARAYNASRLSPDGLRLATSIARGSGHDLWVYDVATGAGLPLTEDDELNWVPIWAPDGRTIYFSSTKDAPRPDSYRGNLWYGNLYSVPADGSSAAVRLDTSEDNQVITSVTPDGQMLLYSNVVDNASLWEIMTVPRDWSTDPVALISGPSRRGSADISPNGEWLAYRSDESGVWEIYVQPYPGPGARVAVSIGGGVQPVWSASGRELFYRGADGMMMSATITGEGTPIVSERTALFSTASYRTGAGQRLYHVAPDGRFLMMRRPGTSASGDAQASAPRITVVLNWFEELRERVPVD